MFKVSAYGRSAFGGKKTAIFNLAFLLLSLAFPKANVFESALLNQKTNNITSISNTVVTVTVANQAANVVVAKASETSNIDCQKNAGDSANLVQDTGLINLNQSSNCFTLKLGQPMVVVHQLAVLPLVSNNKTVTVSFPKQIIESPDLIPSPISQSLPMLPLSMFSLAVLFLGFENKVKKLALKFANSPLKQSLSLAQLQVLRC